MTYLSQNSYRNKEHSLSAARPLVILTNIHEQSANISLQSITIFIQQLKPENGKYIGCIGKEMFYSRIFRPITTARLQVVAAKSGMYSWEINTFIDFLSNGWERGQVWACSKFVGGNKNNAKINSMVMRKIFVFCK